MAVTGAPRIDQFHHDRTHIAAFFEAVDVRDVGVIECRQRLRFACEPREPVEVAGERVGHTFSATSRLSFVSRARNTSPIPPTPMLAMTS